MTSHDDNFREEADELLADLEAALLALEAQPDDSFSVDLAFRSMHTIKGSGAMLGFDDLAAFTHHLENAFELVRSGELQITRELISIGLASGDHIRAMLLDKEPSVEVEEASVGLLTRLGDLVPSVARDMASEQFPGEAAPAESISVESTLAEKKDGVEVTYHLRINPTPESLSEGMDPLPVLRELCALGTCCITLLTDNVPTLDELDPETCYLSWDLVLTTNQGRNAVDDVFIFVNEDWSIEVEILDKGEASASEEKMGQALSSSIQPVEDAVKDAQVERKTSQAVANVRVPAEKLDILMDLVGELVIAQARLNQSSSDLQDASLVSIAEDMERLTTDLRDNTLGLRMLPIGTTFARYRRLVRDLADDQGKEIELITEGAETELDKTVIDRLGDPLVHLIRNSVDHGIETPEMRKAAGKPAKGTILLSAVHSESQVIIRIKDDGVGLDESAIRAKAIERGVLTEEDEPTSQELYNLIFDAGFSTAKSISNVSGRGVGMDVVRRSIESLRGKVWIDSESGKGSTITIELPLTLAIIEGLLVKIEDDCYVLPLSLVEECIELTSDEVQKANGNQLIEVRGELVPYMRLREWFGQGGIRPDIEQIVVTRLGDIQFGFTVDQVVGQHQTVIKGLGKIYEGVKGLSGATILGDGRVALILDAPKLIQDVRIESQAVH